MVRGDKKNILAYRPSLMESYCIKWATDLDDEPPAKFHGLFESIKVLGSKKYKEWDNQQNLGLARWRKEILRRSNKIMRDAIHYRQAGADSNEHSWRNLENDMFEHFKYGAMCGKCRAPTWQLDVTDLPQDNGLGMEKPNTGRAGDECHCDPYDVDWQRSRALVDRASPDFHYETDLRTCLNKLTEQPDLVFGLMRKDNVRFWTDALRTGPDASSFPLSPFVSDMTSCLFPFLICEAKGGYAKTNVLLIESQMAFSIRQALLVQRNLATQGGKCKRNFQPLVWCISYHGENCELHAAYLSPEIEAATYDLFDTMRSLETVVVRLWHGKLTERDGTLQFLLMMDFISTWAEKVYCRNIVRSVKLCLPNAAHPDVYESSQSDDDDIEGDTTVAEPPGDIPPRHHGDSMVTKQALLSRMSQMIEEDEWMGVDESVDEDDSVEGDRSEGKDGSAEEARQRQYKTPSRPPSQLPKKETANAEVSEDNFSHFDTAGCKYRDARYMELRAIGLIITPDNIEQFQSPEQSPGARLYKLAVQLAKGDLAFMTAETLQYLENAWAGRCSPVLGSQRPGRPFYVLLQFSAYMSQDWRQVHEMSYYAVSTSVLAKITRLYGAKRSYRVSTVTMQRARALMGIFHGASLHANLSACAYRVLICPILEWRPLVIGHDNIFETISQEKPIWMWPLKKSAASRNYLWYLYRKDDTLENRLLYLHVLDDVVKQPILRPQGLKGGSPWTGYPFARRDSLILCKDDYSWCMFVIGEGQLSSLTPNSSGIRAACETKRHEPKGPGLIGEWNCTYNLVSPRRLVEEKVGLFIQDLVEAWAKRNKVGQNRKYCGTAEQN